MTECVFEDGPHTGGVGYFNPEDGPGPMCRRHYNEWRHEQGKQVRHTSRRQRLDSQESQEQRHRIVSGQSWRDAL